MAHHGQGLFISCRFFYSTGFSRLPRNKKMKARFFETHLQFRRKIQVSIEIKRMLPFFDTCLLVCCCCRYINIQFVSIILLINQLDLNPTLVDYLNWEFSNSFFSISIKLQRLEIYSEILLCSTKALFWKYILHKPLEIFKRRA